MKVKTKLTYHFNVIFNDINNIIILYHYLVSFSITNKRVFVLMHQFYREKLPVTINH